MRVLRSAGWTIILFSLILRKPDWPGVENTESLYRQIAVRWNPTLASFRKQISWFYARWTLNDPYYQISRRIHWLCEAMRNLQEIRRSFRSATLITDRIPERKKYWIYEHSGCESRKESIKVRLDYFGDLYLPDDHWVDDDLCVWL